MLKDINGQETKVKNFDDMFEISFAHKREKVIGFARFNPYLKTDNRFCNSMCRGCWYPIEKIENRFIYLSNYSTKMHFGLFNEFVSITGKENNFTSLKKDDKKVIKYFEKKDKEVLELENNRKINYDKLQTKKDKKIEEKEKIITILEEKIKEPEEKTNILNYIKNKILSLNSLKKIKNK